MLYTIAKIIDNINIAARISVENNSVSDQLNDKEVGENAKNGGG